jgi:hypothetical protein
VRAALSQSSDVRLTACSRQGILRLDRRAPAARPTAPPRALTSWSSKPWIGSPTQACAKIQVCSDCQDSLRQQSRRMVALLVDSLRYKARALRPVSFRLGSKPRRAWQLSTEAVRKRGEFLRLAEQSEILRGFLDSERPEGSKKRTK